MRDGGVPPRCLREAGASGDTLPKPMNAENMPSRYGAKFVDARASRRARSLYSTWSETVVENEKKHPAEVREWCRELLLQWGSLVLGVHLILCFNDDSQILVHGPPHAQWYAAIPMARTSDTCWPARSVRTPERNSHHMRKRQTMRMGAMDRAGCHAPCIARPSNTHEVTSKVRFGWDRRKMEPEERPLDPYA